MDNKRYALLVLLGLDACSGEVEMEADTATLSQSVLVTCDTPANAIQRALSHLQQPNPPGYGAWGVDVVLEAQNGVDRAHVLFQSDWSNGFCDAGTWDSTRSMCVGTGPTMRSNLGMISIDWVAQYSPLFTITRADKFNQPSVTVGNALNLRDLACKGGQLVGLDRNGARWSIALDLGYVYW